MNTRICQTCLCKDRSLFSLKELRSSLKNVNILIKNVHQTCGICWECKAIIMKFSKFKTQVSLAQKLLSCNRQNFLSKLNTCLKESYDYLYKYEEPIANVKLELDVIKQEKHCRDTDNFNDNDHCDFDESNNTYDKLKKIVKQEIMKIDKHTLEYSDASDNCAKINFKHTGCDDTNLINIFKIGDNEDNNLDKRIEEHNDRIIIKQKNDINHGETIEYKTLTNRSDINIEAYKNISKSNTKYESNILDSNKSLKKEIQGNRVERKRSNHTVFCNECGEEFKGINTLRAHKRCIHNSKREFICDVCNKTFTNKTRLESHIGTHDATLALKLAYCSKCDVQYKNLAIYRNHLRNSLSHMERRYECKDCFKKFASKVYLKKHQDFYHLKKSSFKCEICNKIFISDYRLKNHNQTHHGLTRSRDHGCNTCGKKFFTMATLRAHKLTHSEARSYMCEDCGDTFKQKPALYTHCRLVHKGFKRKKHS